MIGIYGIYFKKDDTCLYIGQSIDIESRWKNHRWRLENNQHLKDFSFWFEKNNISLDDLIFKTLCICSDKDILKNELEIFFFNEEQPKFYGKIPSKNEKWSHSEKTKSKISNTFRERTITSLDTKLDKILFMCKDEEIPFNQICEELSVSKSTLRWYLKHKNIVCVYNKSSISSQNRSKIISLREEGLSLREIGSLVGTSYESVRRFLQNKDC